MVVPVLPSPRRLLPILACLLGETLTAHGGMYRGPTNVPPPTTPGSRGGLTPAAAGPTTPRSAPDATRWQVWWELHKDSYLGRPRGGPKAITLKHKQDLILPALKRNLDSESNQDMVTACMVALAKIGRDHKDWELLDLFRKRLGRSNQEIREIAALCLGMSKQFGALEDLFALLQDAHRGRRLMRQERVDDRTRAFAAYGLGLLGRALPDAKDKRQIYLEMKKVIEDRSGNRRELRIAALQALRILDVQAERSSGEKRLAWEMAAFLQERLTRLSSKTEQRVQAHVPMVLAVLLGAGTGPEQEACKERFLEIFSGRGNADRVLQQSAAMALGYLLRAAEREPADAERNRQLRIATKRQRDQLARSFAMISMGRIGGEAQYKELRRELIRGKQRDQAWAALGLGLMMRDSPVVSGSRSRRSLRSRIGEDLLDFLKKERSRDLRSAAAVALGLGRHLPAEQILIDLLKRYPTYPDLSGYLASGLALLDSKAAVKVVGDTLPRLTSEPVLMGQVAQAAARLGVPGAATNLQSSLAYSSRHYTLALAATATAMGYLPDIDNVDPLIRILDKKREKKLVRAFAAVALGNMAEEDSLSWSSWYAQGVNYGANVETLSNGSTGILDIL